MSRYAITCCKDCCKRFPGCHASCEEYIKQRAAYDEKKEEYMKQYITATTISQQKFDCLHKVTKYKNYRRKYR